MVADGVWFTWAAMISLWNLTQRLHVDLRRQASAVCPR
jgi:hypothetical protein